jgi:hypothetical protein
VEDFFGHGVLVSLEDVMVDDWLMWVGLMRVYFFVSAPAHVILCDFCYLKIICNFV